MELEDVDLRTTRMSRYDQFCRGINPWAYLVGEVLVLRASDPTSGSAGVAAVLGRRFTMEDIERPNEALDNLKLELHFSATWDTLLHHGFYVVTSASGDYDGQVLAARVDHETREISITKPIGRLDGPLAPHKTLVIDPDHEIMFDLSIAGELLVVEVIGHEFPD